MTDVEPATEEAATPDEAYVAPPAKGGARRWLPWALVVVFAATAIAMTWVAASLDRDLDEARGGDTDVSRVAGRFAEAFFTLDYREPDRWHDNVVALSTGGFEDEFDEAFKGGLDKLLQETKPVWTVTVDDVLVSGTESGKAAAVTVVDISQDGAGGQKEIANAYVRLGLVRVDDVWRVASVTYPKATDAEPLGPAAGSGSTPTTTP